MSDEYEGYLRWKVSAQQQIDWYREEVRELKAENAKLRQQLADVTESMGRVEERCAKLRELIIALVCCTNDKTDCDQCPMNGVYCEKVQQCFCDDMKEALAEIGIEVSA